ncbi:MAG: 1,4-dihydroxy-6-naphthoate synthase [Deltaproteobacteria bacterium]|nr:1,4-dihydroxy-6-naphthoate synthase [Deltaproteobacteria bacterium]
MTYKKSLRLGYSTCPNDTFIFYALAHNLIDCEGFEFKIELQDVETLNQQAKTCMIDISKLSFAAMGHLHDKYGLLHTGAALGRGCGPLIVARPGAKLVQLESNRIAVPGLWTTACMLLGLFISGKPDAVPLPFDKIMPAIQKGDFDFGVIIHEGRFTFKQYGLVKLLDLGKWWESETSLPIPLGGIAIRRDLGKKTAKIVNTAINASVKYAFNNRSKTDQYIKNHAQEMEQSVIRQHIDLYVNDFTLDLGDEGAEAVEKLFFIARNRGVIPKSDLPVFAF